MSARLTELYPAERHVHHHHDDEAPHGPDGSDIGMLAGLCLGDQLLEDHVNHGAGREGKGVWQDRAHQQDGRCAQDARDRLYDGRQLALEEAFASR